MNRVETLEKVISKSSSKNEEQLHFIDTHKVVDLLNDKEITIEEEKDSLHS